MCCEESVFFDLQWHTRDQLSKWSYTNNEYWKSALFKFVTISQTGTFNAVRITNSIKCVWYWLSTGIQWKLLWYCSPRNCYRGISVLHIFTKSLWVAHIWKLHQFHINSRVYYCNSNMGFKIFDSHARDLYDGGQPQGTCILLEVLPPDSLVHYYQSIHNNDLYEVRGVQIENIQNRTVSQNSLNETINFNLSCDVALYSLCYPINKIM